MQYAILVIPYKPLDVVSAHVICDKPLRLVRVLVTLLHATLLLQVKSCVW